MLKKLKRYGLAAALLAGSFAVATTAEARNRHRGNDTAAIAIGAGIVGLAVGALIADRDDGYYYDRDYYPHRRYVRVTGYPGYYYYYDGYPNRYYRDRYYGQYYGRRYSNRSDRGYYGNRWNRGYDRSYRGYSRGSRDGYRGQYRGDRRGDYRDRRRY
jgi:hypothetical protein